MPGVELAGSCGNSLFNLLRNHQTFLQQPYHFIFPPAMYKGSDICTSLATLVIFLWWWWWPFQWAFNKALFIMAIANVHRALIVTILTLSSSCLIAFNSLQQRCEVGEEIRAWKSWNTCPRPRSKLWQSDPRACCLGCYMTDGTSELIVTATWGKVYYQPHLSDGETESQRRAGTFPMPTHLKSSRSIPLQTPWCFASTM